MPSSPAAAHGSAPSAARPRRAVPVRGRQGTASTGGHGRALRMGHGGAEARGVQPAPQPVPGSTEEQEQADELWNKSPLFDARFNFGSAGRLSSTRLRLCSIKDVHQKVFHLDKILSYHFWQLARMHHYSYFGKLV